MNDESNVNGDLEISNDKVNDESKANEDEDLEISNDKVNDESRANEDEDLKINHCSTGHLPFKNNLI